MTYHSLTPRQQRVWDAAYGAAYAAARAEVDWRSNEQCESMARETADRAANSIQPNETEPNECHT